MIIAAMTFRLHAPWVHSLKEKRILKSKNVCTFLLFKYHRDDQPISAPAGMMGSAVRRRRVSVPSSFFATEDSSMP